MSFIIAGTEGQIRGKVANLEGENFPGSSETELAWGTIAGSLENNGPISIVDTDDNNIY